MKPFRLRLDGPIRCSQINATFVVLCLCWFLCVRYLADCFQNFADLITENMCMY